MILIGLLAEPGAVDGVWWSPVVGQVILFEVMVACFARVMMWWSWFNG